MDPSRAGSESVLAPRAMLAWLVVLNRPGADGLAVLPLRSRRGQIEGQCGGIAGNPSCRCWTRPGGRLAVRIDPSEDQWFEQQRAVGRGGAVHWPPDADGRLGMSSMQDSPTRVFVCLAAGREDSEWGPPFWADG